MGLMALIVFFRGINVGGHRAFRPSVLAKELGIYDAVNVGAAGTLVVRKPGLRATFLAELRRKLPFEATIAFCDGSDLIRLEMDNPFGTEPPPTDVVQFVSILSEAGRRRVSLPIALPEGGEWLVRIIGSTGPGNVSPAHIDRFESNIRPPRPAPTPSVVPGLAPGERVSTRRRTRQLS